MTAARWRNPSKPCDLEGRVADGHHVEIQTNSARGPVSCSDCTKLCAFIKGTQTLLQAPVGCKRNLSLTL